MVKNPCFLKKYFFQFVYQQNNLTKETTNLLVAAGVACGNEFALGIALLLQVGLCGLEGSDFAVALADSLVQCLNLLRAISQVRQVAVGGLLELLNLASTHVQLRGLLRARALGLFQLALRGLELTLQFGAFLLERIAFLHTKTRMKEIRTVKLPINVFF